MAGVYALIPAAGRGVRFGAPQNKVFAPLLGRPLLGWTLQAFADCAAVDHIVLIGNHDDLPRLREIGEQFGKGKVRDVVLGGADRQESVRNGIAVCPDAAFILVHDGARPCVTPEQIRGAIGVAQRSGAASLAVPVTDTLIRARGNAAIDRNKLLAIQTPQVFAAAVLRDAHENALRTDFVGTDDASLVRHAGGTVALVPSSPSNLKVTRPEDLAFAEAILAQRRPAASPLPDFRIGHGYDVHPFADASENRTLVLGGVPFPDAPRGMKAHSDGDVVLHALCDALLGAAGHGDIGILFPPSDLRHKNRSSLEFLREVAALLAAQNWRVSNVDMTILAETPKIGPFADAMKERISVVLGVSPAQVGIKATTNEGMGFIGRGEGIAVHAAALLMRS